jgi:ribose 5-phosphate isomerase
LVEGGMLMSLGTGSTAALFVRALGERDGLRITGVATSEALAPLAAPQASIAVLLPLVLVAPPLGGRLSARPAAQAAC